jgi:hypothetical protein
LVSLWNHAGDRGLVLGGVQRRAKQRKDARESLTTAIEVFEQLGASRWAERAAAERARVGGRTTIEGLSETELRVAQLVAAGKSNNEVAAEPKRPAALCRGALNSMGAGSDRAAPDPTSPADHVPAHDHDHGADDGDDDGR